MSKRELKKYLQQLSKEQLEYQIETLYNKFKLTLRHSILQQAI